MNEIVAVQLHLGSSLAPEMCRNNNYVLIPQSARTAPRVNVFSTHCFSKTSHLQPSSWTTSSLFVHDCKPFSSSSLLLLQTRLGCSLCFFSCGVDGCSRSACSSEKMTKHRQMCALWMMEP